MTCQSPCDHGKRKFIFSLVHMNHDKSREWCQLMKGDLAVIQDTETWKSLHRCCKKDHKHYQFGLGVCPDGSGRYKWINNDTCLDLPYLSSFIPAKPDCASILARLSDIRPNGYPPVGFAPCRDEINLNRNHFICEIYESWKDPFARQTDFLPPTRTLLERSTIPPDISNDSITLQESNLSPSTVVTIILAVVLFILLIVLIVFVIKCKGLRQFVGQKLRTPYKDSPNHNQPPPPPSNRRTVRHHRNGMPETTV